MSADDDVVVAPALTDEEIVAGVATHGVAEDTSDDDEGDDAEVEDHHPRLTNVDALHMVQSLKDFFLGHATASEKDVNEAFRCVDKIEQVIVANTVANRQQQITDFFK